jgi:hypothetical protein
VAISTYKSEVAVKRFVEVREREDDRTSRLICMIDFSLGLMVIYIKGIRHVVMLDDEYERWHQRFSMASAGAVDKSAIDIDDS